MQQKTKQEKGQKLGGFLLLLISQDNQDINHMENITHLSGSNWSEIRRSEFFPQID